MKRINIMAILSILFMLFFPALAGAQESEESSKDVRTDDSCQSSFCEITEVPKVYTAKDHFGGWKISISQALGVSLHNHDPEWEGAYAEPDNTYRSLRNDTHDNSNLSSINYTMQL